MIWKVWGYKDETPLLIIEALKKARKNHRDYNVTQRCTKEEEEKYVDITERSH